MSSTQVNWSRYATDYDLIRKYIPAYRRLMDHFRATIRSWRFADGGQLVDLGAGTGNFSTILAKRFATNHVVHVDVNAAMNAVATEKAARLSLSNWETRCVDAWQCDFECDSVSAITSIHALYAIPHPQRYLQRIHEWLQPGGYAYLCDTGRSMPIRSWATILFRENRRRMGSLRALGVLWRAKNIAKQNRRIANNRRDGHYWSHTLEEFRGAVESTGLTIQCAGTAYCGISDFVVARKPDLSAGPRPRDLRSTSMPTQPMEQLR